MDRIARVILCPISTSICNLKCRYCYLSQRDEAFQGQQAAFQYAPEYVARALSKERLGGVCYFNLCADGETLLTKDIDKYIVALAKEGHYVEIVSNLTISSMIDKILCSDKAVLDHITFKCSFHYLQLKERGLLEVFASNVQKIWAQAGSASIEVTPDDELIPYIDELKEFSFKHFGALPHLTIARDDRTGHGFLTELSPKDYFDIWSSFESDFWKFKMETFNVKRREFCYAGAWSLVVSLETGEARQCYCSQFVQNVFKHVEKPIQWEAIGKCQETHCFNSHALLTLGCIPHFTNVRYGEIRDREKANGEHWLQPQIKSFLSTKLEDSNAGYKRRKRMFTIVKSTFRKSVTKIERYIFK